MKFRLLKTDIPVYSSSISNEIVRYLQSEDLDGTLYQDLIHDNVEKIVMDTDKKLSYSAKATPFSFLVVQPGKKYRTGFQGTFKPVESDLEYAGYDLEMVAVWYAIGVQADRIGQGVYEYYLGKARWHIVSSEEESDRHVTIRVGEESHTFYFKRLWENEERKDIAEIAKPERHGKQSR